MKLNDVINNKQRKYSFYIPERYGRDFPRIPTGIFSYDFCIGSGMPVGVTSSLYGPEGGGKSTVLALTMASAQRICWNCFEYLWDCDCGEKTPKKVVIIDLEGLDLDWAEKLGVNVDDLVLAQPATGEEAVDIIYEVLNTEDCGLVALDSFSRVIPEQEITDPALSYQVGSRGKLHTKLINKVKSTLIEKKKKNINSSFIAVNQLRAVIGGMQYGPTEEAQGCKASKHDWHLTCRMSQLKTKPEYIDKETELPLYGRFKASIISPGVKRKLLTLAGTCEFFIAMQDTTEHSQGTVFDHKTTIDYAEKIGMLDRTKWDFDGVKYGTKTKLLEEWKNDPQKFLSAKKKIVDQYVKIKKRQIEDTSKSEKEADET